MEGLGGEDRFDRRVRERNGLRASRQRLRLRAESGEEVAHSRVRLDGDDMVKGGNEQPRELARPRAQLEHGRRRRQSWDPHDLERPARPAPLVGVVPAAGPARVDVGHGEMGGDGIEHTCSMRCGTGLALVFASVVLWANEIG